MKSEHVNIVASVFLLMIGVTCNPWIIGNIFSADGVINDFYLKLVLLALEATFITLGIYIFLKRCEVYNFNNAFILKTATFIKNQYRHIYVLFIALLLIIQFSHLVSIISIQSDNYGITYSRDVDAGQIIPVVKRTRLYNDNEYHTYGPLYFRFAHSIYKSAPPSDRAGSEEEKSEEKIHYSLLLISLLSLYGISYLLSSLIIKERRFKLLGTLFITSSFLMNKTWVGYSVIHAHPDLLLSLFSGLFCYFIFNSLLYPDKEMYYYWAGIMGGFALSTKMSFLLFLPGLFFLKMPPFNNRNLKKIIYLYFLIALSYFFAGFPQNFKIWGAIDNLQYQSSLTTPPTWQSILTECNYLFSQTWFTVIILFIMFLAIGKESVHSRQDMNKHINNRICAIVCLPFLIIITKRYLAVSQHYILPFSVAILVGISIWMLSLRWVWVEQLKAIANKEWVKMVLSVFLIFLVQSSYGFVPNKVDSYSKRHLSCREESRMVYNKIKEFKDQDKLILIDPYVPHTDESEMYQHSWRHTINNLKERKPDVLVLRALYYQRFLIEDVDEYTQVGHMADLQKVQEFYALFAGKKEVVDPFEQKWVKTYEDKCGFEIWEKEE